MAKKPDTAGQVLAAALSLAAEQGWRNVTMPEVAVRAALPLPDLYQYASSKAALLDRMGQMVDERVLAGGEADPEENVRDRLFDLLMRRFDALNEHRQGFRAILEDLRRDPPLALCQLMNLRRGMGWTLEMAGLSADGVRGALRLRALGVVYLLVLRTWLDDDTEDMARTMATLDRRLRQAEQMADMIERGPRMPGRWARPEPSAEDPDDFAAAQQND